MGQTLVNIAAPCLLHIVPEPIDYVTAWAWQQSLVAERKLNPDLPDVLLIVQHPPVYTLGQGADLCHVKFDADDPAIPCHRIERGGEVTYHAPGQLVGYPILNLNRHQRDLHWYMRQLEAVIIDVLDYLFHNQSVDDVNPYCAHRREGLTGVWVSNYNNYLGNQAPAKVAQIGIKASRWITMHGFALNIAMDLTGFQHIVPCGIADCVVANVVDFVPTANYEQIQALVTNAFAERFNLRFI
ncbi:MAG: lipoyl(octanoyl) transferase LipB [Pseudanabaena sp. ELA607]